MQNIFTNEEEIKTLKEAGKKLAQIIFDLEKFSQIGMEVSKLDEKTLELIKKAGAKPATVGYTPRGADFPFPSSVCVSINDEVAHGISTNNSRKLKEGDLVSADIVIEYKNLFVDLCRSWIVGKDVFGYGKILEASKKATQNAIEKAVVGNITENIGEEAEKTAKSFGFDTVKELGGHGVGRAIHQEPFIPNGKNLGVPIVKLKEGMLLAIEPIVCQKDWKIKLEKDGYLFKTEDGGVCSQFEETVLITKNGPEILTKI